MKCIFLLIVIACVVGGWKCVPDAVASGLSKRLGVDVSIGDISGDLNHIYISKIQIYNPSASVLPHAFTCQKITIHASAPTYLEEEVVIQEIDMEKVYFDIEFNRPQGKNGNWKTLVENAFNSKEDMHNEMRGKSDLKDATRTVEIKNLVLTEVTTDLVYRNKKEVKRLPDIGRIILSDLKSEGGPVVAQILKLVLGQSLKAVFEEQHLKQGLPGGRLKYLLPLRRSTTTQAS